MVEPDTGPPLTPGEGTRTVEQVRSAGYLDDLGSRPLPWIRSERAGIRQMEDGISYVRRLVQGRLDIVTAEAARRQDGSDHDLHSLVDQLPEILAGGGHASGHGRLTTVSAPAAVDPELARRMGEAASDGVLTRLTEVDDAELALAAERLRVLEADISSQRRACHEALDRLEAEVVRRYRNGEASVDSLLP